MGYAAPKTVDREPPRLFQPRIPPVTHRQTPATECHLAQLANAVPVTDRAVNQGPVSAALVDPLLACRRPRPSNRTGDEPPGPPGPPQQPHRTTDSRICPDLRPIREPSITALSVRRARGRAVHAVATRPRAAAKDSSPGRHARSGYLEAVPPTPVSAIGSRRA